MNRNWVKIGIGEHIEGAGKSFYLIAVICIACLSISSDIVSNEMIRLYPLPGSRNVAPHVNVQVQLDTDIGTEMFDIEGTLIVEGKKQGQYEGVILKANHHTLIFNPEKAFLPGDRVNVFIGIPGINHHIFHFTIREKMVTDKEKKEFYQFYQNKYSPVARTQKKSVEKEQNGRPRLINGVAVPADFPEVVPTIIKKGIAPGYLFLNNWIGSPYILILNNDGTPYFHRKVEEQSSDFKVQATGELSRRVLADINGFQTMDRNYNTIHTWKARGYETDEHELQITPDGTAYIIGIDIRRVDMSELIDGGYTNALVAGQLVQELDKHGNVLFEWNGWDYFNIIDADHEDLQDNFIDFMHLNSIAVDYDGNIVISIRHLNECTKINRETGAIMWRFGGKYNEFEFIDSGPFSYQHDFRPVPGKEDHYTMFDNGNLRTPRYSRAVEFRLDHEEKKAYKTWEYRHSPDRYSHFMGNVQRLPNGNTHINWADGPLPKATEVTQDGEVVYEADFKESSDCYRSFRFEWDGMLKKPELIIEKYVDMISLIYNKFGDTNVVSYNVYAGSSPGPDEIIANTTDNYINLDATALQQGLTYYFRVNAVYADNSESESSNEVKTFVNFLEPGDNLIINGDFTKGTEHWIFELSGSAEAAGIVTEEGFHFDITESGSEVYNVQLRQNGIPLEYGKKYVFGFDAMADVPRTIEAKVGQDRNPFTNYSKIGLTYIVNRMRHYSYEFIMEHPTDFNARAVINCGVNHHGVVIDNMELREFTNQSDQTNSKYLDNHEWIDIWPQPANECLNFSFHGNHYKDVVIVIYTITGKEVIRKRVKFAEHFTSQIQLDIKSLKKGVYIVRILTDQKQHAAKIMLTP